MPTPPVMIVSPSTYEVVVKGVAVGTVETVTCDNVFHYSSIGAVTPNNSELATFLSVLRGLLASAWAACFPSTGYICNQFSGRWMEDSSTAPVLDTTPHAFDGSYVTGDFQPPDSSWYIEKLTLGAGKSSRGGFKLSPIPEAATLDMKITSAFKSGPAAALATALMLSPDWTVSSRVFRPFLVSRKYSTIVSAGVCTIVGQPLTSVRIRNNLGTMKSRKSVSSY